MYALANRLGDDILTENYKYLPLVDRPLILPASAISLASPVDLDGAKWTFNGSVYNGYMVHQRYISNDAPDLNVGVKRSRIADLTASQWYQDEVFTDRYFHRRGNETENLLKGLYNHNTQYSPDSFPVANAARTCIKQPNTPDPPAPQMPFDRNVAIEVIETICANWPADGLLVPEIFGVTNHTVDGKKKSAEVLRTFVMQGDEEIMYYIRMTVADDCSIPIWVKDAFDRKEDCVAAYREIVDWVC